MENVREFLLGFDVGAPAFPARRLTLEEKKQFAEMLRQAGMLD